MPKRADSDTVVNTTPVQGNLIRPLVPQFLSLVDKPANQIAFKVMRSDQGENPMKKLVRRTRRSDTPSPVLRLTFPEGSTVETATAALVTYGMEGYTVAQDGDKITATRSDLKSISPGDSVAIRLSDAGLVAEVQRSSALAPIEAQPGDKPNITVAAFELDATKFTSDEAAKWMTENSVDGTLQQPQNSDTCYVVRRSDVSDVEETRRMVVEDGVTAVITRSDDPNVPAGYVAVVNEAAYGSWGWGQLDFTSSMADMEFSEQMEDGIYRLGRVLKDILMWSPLPLDTRRELANRSLSQFGEFVGALMESLPRQLLVSVVRSATPNPEKTMTQTTNAGNTTPTPAPNATPAAGEFVTRADFDALKQSVDGLVAAVSRSAPAAEGAAATSAAAAPAAEGAAPTPAVETLTRSDVAQIVADSMAPVTEAVNKLSGLTVVRSEGDPNAGKTGADNTNAKRADDVFRGSIFGNMKTAK